ncbi:MAG: methyltransferase [Limnohabitans sp.]|jgi:SAM-dependent methyltransferase
MLSPSNLPQWRCESGAPAPKRVVYGDDTLPADIAYRLMCEGTAVLWQGDFHNARQLLQALARRTEKKSNKKSTQHRNTHQTIVTSADKPIDTAQTFHLHRQALGQRARVLSLLLIPLDADYRIPLRRAPDVKDACLQAWEPPSGDASMVSLRELLGLVGAYEWRKKGVEIPALGKPPNNRIFPHYGVFSPLRGEYIDLVANTPIRDKTLAFDIGVGTGVLSALLVKRGVQRVIATDQDPRALACARENLERLGVMPKVELVDIDLFPNGLVPLIVCNPPWVPARPTSPIEHAVYDEDSKMLRGFLSGLRAHLTPEGEGWLILSDLAEHLGLRSRETLLHWIDQGGLEVLERKDIKPRHGKTSDTEDPLHIARAAEVTSLWRLGINKKSSGA